MGILTFFLWPRYYSGIQKDQFQTLVLLARLKQGLEAFNYEYGYFPTGNIVVLSSVLSGKNIGGQNLKEIRFLPDSSLQPIDSTGQILDFWGQPLRIEATNAETVAIFSFGRNRIDDGGRGDDIVVHAEPAPKQKP